MFVPPIAHATDLVVELLDPCTFHCCCSDCRVRLNAHCLDLFSGVVTLLGKRFDGVLNNAKLAAQLPVAS